MKRSLSEVDPRTLEKSKKRRNGNLNNRQNGPQHSNGIQSVSNPSSSHISSNINGFQSNFSPSRPSSGMCERLPGQVTTGDDGFQSAFSQSFSGQLTNPVGSELNNIGIQLNIISNQLTNPVGSELNNIGIQLNTLTNQLNNSFPLFPNLETNSTPQPWNTGIGIPSPWGNSRPWAASGSNMNFHNFETGNQINSPSPARHVIPTYNQRFGVEPKSFLSLEDKFLPKDPPSDHCKGVTNRFQKLSREMWYLFNKSQQNGAIFRQKIELWNELERVLRSRFRSTTHVFGSTLNGFGTSESDMDICMFKGENSNKKARDDVRLLAEVRRAIRYLAIIF